MTHVRTGPGQWLAEAVATFGLLLTIFGCVARAPGTVAYAVGLYITAAYWFTASTSFARSSRDHRAGALGHVRRYRPDKRSCIHLCAAHGRTRRAVTGALALDRCRQTSFANSSLRERTGASLPNRPACFDFQEDYRANERISSLDDELSGRQTIGRYCGLWRMCLWSAGRGSDTQERTGRQPASLRTKSPRRKQHLSGGSDSGSDRQLSQNDTYN